MIAGPTPELPAGPERDAMLYGRAFRNGERSVETSLAYAGQISDPTLRRDAFEQVMEESTQFTGTEKHAWEAMESSDFPEEWKAVVRAAKQAR